MPETRNAQRSSPQEEPLTRGAIALLAAPPTFVAMLILATPHPLAVLRVSILVTLSIAFWALMILCFLPDPCVSRTFLIKQFFLGAVPAQFFAQIIKPLMVYSATGLMLGDTNHLRRELYAKNVDPGKHFLWQFILIWLSVVVEEAAKAFLAQRYLRLVVAPPYDLEDGGALHGHADRPNHGAGCRPRQASIGCRGVLACAYTGALGFVSMEYLDHISPIFSSGTTLSLTDAGSFILQSQIFIIIRLQTTSFIGLAMARRTVLKESVSMVKAFAIAVCIRVFSNFFLNWLVWLTLISEFTRRFEAVLQRELML